MAVTRIWDQDNGVWQIVGGSGVLFATDVHLVTSVTPPSPTDGLLWTNPATGITQIWDADNSVWIEVGGGSGGGGAEVPPGVMWPYGGATAPVGYLLCDGSLRNRTTYADLFAVIGETYGPGDGSTTFNLPDLRGRIPLGKAVSGIGSVMADAFGQLNHRHSGPNHQHAMTVHTHGMIGHTHPLGDTGSGGGGGATSGNGSHAHGFSDSFTTGSASSSANAVSVGSPLTSVTPGGHSHSGSVSGSTDTEASHQHTIPNHNHALPDTGGNSQQTGDASSSLTDTGAAGTGNTGTGDPPVLVVNYIIKT